jgi:hypothetical protein
VQRKQDAARRVLPRGRLYCLRDGQYRATVGAIDPGKNIYLLCSGAFAAAARFFYGATRVDVASIFQ